MAHNQNNVSKVYKHVIDEVIKNVRESFLNDGVDEQVLQELKQIWENKVAQSKAVDAPEPKQPRAHSYNPVLLSQPPAVNNSQHQQNVVRRHAQPIPVQPAVSTTPVTVTQQGQHYITAAAQPQYIAAPHAQFTQIMMPGASVPTIQQQMPETSQTHQPTLRPPYHGLPVTAIQAPRQTVQNVQNQHQHVTTQQQQTSRPSVINYIQVDGPNDSDSDDDDDDDDEFNESNDEEAEEKVQDDSEPALNSGDDVSDDDSSDLFDTENVVVCQFDRITRSKNKWKFHLKDGIMNLDGKDYVFTKATGEAEW